MDLSLFAPYLPLLASGLGVTALCWAAGTAIGMALGLATALLRALPWWPVRWLSRGWVELLRGTPFLLQLLLLYDGGPSVGLRLSAVAAGVIGLGVYGSAYFAEIFRAGFLAVPVGIVEGAISLGLPPWLILLRVRMPLMLVAITPPLVNMAVILQKETVVLSLITVPEIRYQVQTMATETFAAFEPILALAVLYWALTEAGAALGRAAERRLTAHLA